MFKILKRFIVLSIPAFLATGCVAPGLGLYQQTLANRQAAYQQALKQRDAHQSIFSSGGARQMTPAVSLSPEQQEQERQKAEMQRLAELQRQSKEGVKEIPIGLAQKLLTGTLKGTVCNEKISVEINLTGPQRRERHVLIVGGSLRTFQQREHLNAPAMETPLEGRFDINTGFFNLGTMPIPPTKEQMMEERQRRQQAMAEFESRNREFQMEYIKFLQESRRMAPEERGRVGQELGIKEKLLQDEHYVLLKRNNQPLAQPSAPPISLGIDIGRDPDGRGWAGMIKVDGFNDCDKIALANTEGSTTSELPPITGEVAFNRARPRGFAWPGLEMQMYWLNVAANQGNTNAHFALGQIYEEQGKQAPQDYRRAFQHYRAAADRGNAPAQSALSRLYANGWGTLRDVKESQRWEKLAESQYGRASKVCVAPKMVKEINQLMKEQREDPSLKTAQVLTLVLAQTVVNLGTYQITEIALERLSSIDLPFRCTVTAKRIGMSMTNFTPSFEYAGTDEYGNRQYRDQRFDKLGKEKATDMANELAKQNFTQSFNVEPQGNQLYTVTLVRGMLDSREYSKMVDLH